MRPISAVVGAGLLLAVGSAAVFVWRRGRPPVRHLLELAALALLSQAALFASVHVAEPIRGRFLSWAGLAVMLALCSEAAGPASRRTRALLALALVLAGVAGLRAAIKVGLAGIEQPVTPLPTRISSSRWSGPPDGDVVAPPTYPWIARPPEGRPR